MPDPIEGAENLAAVPPTADAAGDDSLVTNDQSAGDQNLGNSDADAANAGKEGDGADDDRSPTIPRARFDEVNTKYTQAAPKAQQYDETFDLLCQEVPGLREQVAAGKSLPVALRELTENNQRRNQQNTVEQAIKEAHDAIDQGVADGSIGEQWAPYLKQQATTAERAKPVAAQAEETQVMSRASAIRDDIIKAFPNADGDVVKDYILAHRLNPTMAREVAERYQKRFDTEVAARVEQLKPTIIAEYNAATATRSNTAQPERGTGKAAHQSSKSVDISKMSDADFIKWREAEGRKTDQSRYA